jgi:hypothetical protein
LTDSHTTRRFREAFANLPEEIQKQARQAYSLFQKDPHHPSLRFKKVHKEGNIYSARIGLGYRTVGVMRGSTVVWFWIGSHSDFDQLL